ncbi:MAG: hypothetical protein KUG66_03255 [Gammaproteobacteria bacterium]|nr:hypothetical protein [Gammaproteobacteria bacterium]
MAIKTHRSLPLSGAGKPLSILHSSLLFLVISITSNVGAEAAEARDEIHTEMQGISIIGDKESPTVLNLVPWKSPKNLNMIHIEIPSIDTLGPIQRKSLRREINYFYQRQSASREKVKNVTP